MYRKWLIGAVLLLLLAHSGALVGLSHASGVRIAHDNWPPYEYSDRAGSAAGISFEVTRAVLEAMDVSIISVQEVPWSRGLKMLELGQVDILLSGAHTTRRSQYTRYPTEPIFFTEWRAFANCFRGPSTRYATLDSLEGKRVGLVQDYAYPQPFLDRLDAMAKLQVVMSDEANFHKLIDNRVDVVLCDHLNGLWVLHELEMETLVCVTPLPIGSRPIYTMFSKKTVDQQFIDRFSRELAKFKNTPEFERILKSARQYPR